MSTNVSKLVIKACNDNKFSSFTGEFVTSINPENLVIKSAVSYYVPEAMNSANLLRYRGSPPKLLSFSLLFDNTGIMPGSNTIAVVEQIKQLQDVAYSVHKKNNAPNYIRVIWGQVDFKGRLVNLDIAYSMFQVDGTLVRAEAYISVLEELVPLGKGKSAAGVDGKRAQASGSSAISNPRASSAQSLSSQKSFAPTPDGMNGAYSGAPPGAYSGGPDQVYHGANAGDSGSLSSVNATSSGRLGSDVDRSSNGFKGGVSGNGPGGSGGGIGGGGHSSGGSPISGPGQVRGDTTGVGKRVGGSGPSSGSRGVNSDPTRSAKSNLFSSSGGATGKSSHFKVKKGVITGITTGVAGSAAVMAAVASGANSLRKLSGFKANLSFIDSKLGFLLRLKKIVKKVAPKAYDAGKKLWIQYK